MLVTFRSRATELTDMAFVVLGTKYFTLGIGGRTVESVMEGRYQIAVTLPRTRLPVTKPLTIPGGDPALDRLSDFGQWRWFAGRKKWTVTAITIHRLDLAGDRVVGELEFRLGPTKSGKVEVLSISLDDPANTIVNSGPEEASVNDYAERARRTKGYVRQAYWTHIHDLGGAEALATLRQFRETADLDAEDREHLDALIAALEASS